MYAVGYYASGEVVYTYQGSEEVRLTGIKDVAGEIENDSRLPIYMIAWGTGRTLAEAEIEAGLVAAARF